MFYIEQQEKCNVLISLKSAPSSHSDELTGSFVAEIKILCGDCLNWYIYWRLAILTVLPMAMLAQQKIS